MQDIIRIGKIHTIDYTKGTASVLYSDRNNQPSPQLPFLSTMYDMPAVDDTVVVVLFPNSTSKGVILGVPWSTRKKPPIFGAGIFYKAFSDGSYIKYDVKTKKMEISAPNIVLESVTAENISVKEKLTATSIEVKKLVSDELFAETANIKNLNVTGKATGSFQTGQEDV